MILPPNLLSILFLLGVSFVADVSCVQVTLLTTEGTTTDLKWEVENINEPPGFSGWEDTSIPYKDSIVRGYQVCEYDNDPTLKEKPQTWLLLPGVNIDGASRIFIEMNFTMRECSDLEKTCRETFSVYYRLVEKNGSGNEEQEFDARLFQKIDTVAAEVRFSPLTSTPNSWNSLINSETVSISFTNSTKTASLHIAIVDAGACVALMGVRIYHKVCHETNAGFANFEETKTGVSDTSLVPVTGICVANAVYLHSGSLSSDMSANQIATSGPVLSNQPSGPLYHCTSSGDWQVQTGSCRCKPGHQPDQTKSKCIPCESGKYKTSAGNHNCMECPTHSSTAAIGATTCQCDPGYDIIGENSEKVLTDIDFGTYDSGECELCSKMPAAPYGVQIKNMDKGDPGLIEISWKRPPDDGGCSKVHYCVLCHFTPLDAKNQSFFEDAKVCNHLQFEPSRCNFDVPKVTVKELRGHTTYNFTVFAFTLSTKQKFPSVIDNLATDSDSEKMNFSIEGIGSYYTEDMQSLLQASSIYVAHTTNDTLPSAVRDPTITMENQTAIFVKWTEPVFPNGKILYYKVRYCLVYGDESEEPSEFPVPARSILIKQIIWDEVTTNETATLLTDLYPGSKYQIFITAHNSAGSDNGSAPLSAMTVSFDDGDSEHPTNSDNFPYLVATVVIATLVALICVLLVIQWKCRSRKKKENMNGTTDHPTQFRPYNSHHETLDQRTYVDPFSLDAMPPHRFLCETSVESITCGQVIGCGEFGEVYKGTLATIDLKTGQETTIDVAIKQLRDQCEPQEQIDFLREAMSLEKFRHPNIVHLEAVVTKTRPFFIVTELMDHGSLHGYITQLKDKAKTQTNVRGWTLPISHTAMVKMLQGVASGMAYLSGRGYVHRDLAARNVLINSDLVCKVADFGLMREIENNDSESGSNGSGTYTTRGGKIAIRWTAPEAIAFRTFTQFSDVWSFGILMWEAASFGEKPYWDLTNHEVIKAATEGMRLPAPEKCPSVFHQLMLECWQRDHHKRPTFTKIIAKFNQMISEPDILEVPASPASCGVIQQMFFGEDEIAPDVSDTTPEPENPRIPQQDDNHEENLSTDPLLTTVVVDRHNIDYDLDDHDSTDDEFEPTNRDEEEGSEVSSCTSTICGSEITVCAGNGGIAVYVPLLRSDSDEIRPMTPVTRNYYSLTR